MSVKIYFGENTVLVDEEFVQEATNGKYKVLIYSGKKYLAKVRDLKGECKTRLFHRIVIGAKKGEIVDHINCDSLDNRRENLRVVTHSQNLRNSLKIKKTSSRFKGVSAKKKKWDARIATEDGQIRLGYFLDEVEAAYHYDIASLKYHGEHGRRNFLPLVISS